MQVFGGGEAVKRGNSALARTNTVCFLKIPPRATRGAPADKHAGPYITPRQPCRCAQSRNTYIFVSTSSQCEPSPRSKAISPNLLSGSDFVSKAMYTKHVRAKAGSVNVRQQNKVSCTAAVCNGGTFLMSLDWSLSSPVCSAADSSWRLHDSRLMNGLAHKLDSKVEHEKRTWSSGLTGICIWLLARCSAFLITPLIFNQPFNVPSILILKPWKWINLVPKCFQRLSTLAPLA